MRSRLAVTTVFVLLAASCGGGDDPAATTTTQPSTDTTTTTLAAAAEWARVPGIAAIFGGPGDDVIAGVVAGGPGLVAVGSDYDGGNGSDGGEISDGDAAVWTSPDGTTWTRVAHDEAVFGGDSYQEMQSVTVFGSTLVAVGVDHSAGDVDAAVWTSPDGVNWSRVVASEAVLGGPGDQAMLRVSAGGPGLIAVGFDDATGEFDWDAAIWTSADGVNWTRVPHDETLFGGERNQVMWGVASSSSGLVAIGFDRSGDDVDAAVWTSSDGSTWSRVAHDEAIFGGAGNQRMTDIASGAAGLVVVGQDNSGGDLDAAVWTSADGITWIRVVNPEAVFGGDGDQEMSGVEYSGSGLIAVGSDGAAGDLDAAVWASTDGLTWTRVADPSGAFGGSDAQDMGKLAVGDFGVVAVGSDRAAGDLDAAVWILAG